MLAGVNLTWIWDLAVTDGKEEAEEIRGRREEKDEKKVEECVQKMYHTLPT